MDDKIKTQHLDQMFDEALKRTEKGVAVSQPYGTHPLASDHFLLKNSDLIPKNQNLCLRDSSAFQAETKG